MNITRSNRTFTALGALAMGLTALALAGCAPASGSAAEGEVATELRLGYFANVTHAPALVGLSEELFADALGDIDLTTEVFNAGPAAIEALSAGAIDATYIGPNPAINTFIQSGGASAHIIAGATSGGAALVVREGIDSPADLNGATLASPQLGNTQDVALRSWLADEGYETSISGAGDVAITPTENAQTLTLFQDGQLDGASLAQLLPLVTGDDESASSGILMVILNAVVSLLPSVLGDSGSMGELGSAGQFLCTISPSLLGGGSGEGQAGGTGAGGTETDAETGAGAAEAGAAGLGGAPSALLGMLTNGAGSTGR